MLLQKLQKIIFASIKKTFPEYIVGSDEIKFNNLENKYNFDCKIAFLLSKKLKLKPIEIADKICNNINIENITFSSIKPGFINIKLDNSLLIKLIDNFSFNSLMVETKQKKINIEIVSANPTGSIHVGHIRNGLIGTVLGNLYKAKNNLVSYSYYLNDDGSQIKNLVTSVFLQLCKKNKLKIILKNSDESKLYESDEIKDCAQNLFIYLRENNLVINKFVYEKKFVPKKFIVLKDFCISFFLKKIRTDLKKLGIKIDKYYKESNFLKPHKIKLLFKNLEKYTYKKDNALWLKSKANGIDDKNRVLVKSNGHYTYFVSDLIYHEYKLNMGYDKIINVWGSDHYGYINRIKSGLYYLFNGDKIVNNLTFLINQIIKIKKDNKEIKISKRLNTGLYLSWLEKNLKSIDYLKYLLLEKQPQQHTIINLNKITEKITSIPYYYIQYTYVRILGIQKKLLALNSKKISGKPIISENIKNLLIFIYSIDNFITSAITKNNPSIFVNYIYKFCKLVNKFYKVEKIITENNANLKLVKIKILKIIIVQLDKIFAIICIKGLKTL